jgi:tetratricopeptide (TPR) repeat protein
MIMLKREGIIVAKRGIPYFGIITALLVLGCVSQPREEREFDELTAMEQEYARIIESGKRGKELVEMFLEFDHKYPKHFSAKVDLGRYYLVIGDIRLAKEYLFKALTLIKNAPRTKEGEEYITIMYASLAEINKFEKNYVKAAEYAELALSFDNKYAWKVLYVRAAIIAAEGKDREALTLFDKAYQEHPELIEEGDIKVFLPLLGSAGRYSECAGILDFFFENGEGFFTGLGNYAAHIYEKAGQLKKAIYASFLEFEFQISYRQEEPKEFLNKLDVLEAEMEHRGILDEGNKEAIRLIRSVYDPSLEYPRFKQEPSYFVERYIIIKNRIRDQDITPIELKIFFDLLLYFHKFPVYYWNLWQAAGMVDKLNEEKYAIILERIIALDENGVYAQPARDELERISGF